MSNEALILQAPSSLVSFRNEGRADIGKKLRVSNYKGKNNVIKAWGSDNLLPNRREAILMDNNVLGSIMTTKRDIILGTGLKPYIEIINDKKERVQEPVIIDPDIEKWMEDAEFHKNYLEPAAESLIKHGNIFAGMMTDLKSGIPGIANVKAYDSKYIRAQKKKKSDLMVKGFLHHENWSKISDTDYSFTHIPAFNKESTKLSIYHTGDTFFNDGYYSHPVYYGGSEWIELSNAIPKWQKANLKNGFALKYHVEIPADFFLDKDRYRKVASDSKKAKKCIDKARAKKQKFVDELNGILSGIGNAGRSIVTTKRLDQMTKKYEGITISTITTEMYDEKLLKLFNSATDALVSGQNIHPTIANTHVQGKLSSGNEMRHAVNFHVGFKAGTPRRQLLEPWHIVLKRNGWYDKKINNRRVKWRFEDIKLDTTDENKKGMSQPKIETE